MYPKPVQHRRVVRNLVRLVEDHNPLTACLMLAAVPPAWHSQSIVHHDLVPGGALLAVALPVVVMKSVDPFKDTRGVVVLHYVLAFSLVTCRTLMSAI